MIKKAVILTGGMATRFLPISKSIPKEMLPVLNKPVLQLVIEDLHKAGITEVLMINGRNKESIIRHFDRNIELEERLIQTKRFDLLEQIMYPTTLCDITYKQQLCAKGTGYCMHMAKNFVNDEPFVLMFGDELLFNDGKNVVEQLLECYNKYKKNVIAVQQVPKSEVYKYGIIKIKEKLGKDYIFDKIIEKPTVEDAPSDISYIGPAIFKKDIFDAVDNLPRIEGREVILTEAFNELAEKGEFVACSVKGDRHDLGNKFGFLKANIFAGVHDKEIKQQTLEYLKQILKDNL